MRPTKETEVLTIATVREAERGAVEVLFNEREQVFALGGAAKSRAAGVVDRLKEAHDRKVPVKAVVNPRLGTIQTITAPAPRELEKFARARVVLDNPDKPRRVNL